MFPFSIFLFSQLAIGFFMLPVSHEWHRLDPEAYPEDDQKRAIKWTELDQKSLNRLNDLFLNS